MSDKFLERDPIYETRAQKILRLSKKQSFNALTDRRQPFKGTGDSSRINLQLENGEPSASIHRDGVSKDIGDFLNIYKNSSTILNDHEGEFSSAPLLLDVNQCVSMNPVSEDIGNILNANQSCIMKVLHHEEVACSSRQEEISKNDDNSHYHVLQNYFENTPDKSISIHSELSSSDDYVNGTEVSSSSEGESTATRRVQNRIKRRLNDKKGSLKSCIEIDGISTDLVNEININEQSIGRNPMDEIINTEEENLESNSNKINKRGGRQINEKKSRKRIRNNNKWKRNVRKKAKDSGMEYMSVTGKLKPAKILQPPCKPSCRKKCYERISEEDRVSLHESFYNLPSDCQNQFLCDSVEEFDKKTQGIRDDKRESRRQYTRKYSFKLKNKVEKTEVCQTMFLNTFSITLMKMRVIVEKKTEVGKQHAASRW